MEQRKKQILLVEDDPDVRELLQTVLEQAGYAVIAVDQGATAKQALATVPCDLLISDYHLPDTRGNFLILYARATYPQMATMLISGEADVESLASLCNADAWFRKSEALDGFLAAVTTVCAASCPAIVSMPCI